MRSELISIVKFRNLASPRGPTFTFERRVSTEYVPDYGLFGEFEAKILTVSYFNFRVYFACYPPGSFK